MIKFTTILATMLAIAAIVMMATTSAPVYSMLVMAAAITSALYNIISREEETSIYH